MWLPEKLLGRSGSAKDPTPLPSIRPPAGSMPPAARARWPWWAAMTTATMGCWPAFRRARAPRPWRSIPRASACTWLPRNTKWLLRQAPSSRTLGPRPSRAAFSCWWSRRCSKVAYLRSSPVVAMMAPNILASAAALGCMFAANAACASPLSPPSHTVIVVLENHSASQVYDNPEMPFFNAIARQGAVLTNASFAQIPYGRTPKGFAGPLPARPSQPNYLFLISGDRQGLAPEYFEFDGAPTPYPYRGMATQRANGDLLAAPLPDVPTGIGNRLVPVQMRPFLTPNLGAAVIARGGSFACFSESLPYPHFDGESFNGGSGLYKRKHNPVINWIDPDARVLQADRRVLVLPETVNLGFAASTDPRTGQQYRGFAVDERGAQLGFDSLPTVSFVVPNQDHDAHDGTLGAADQWLATHIKPYADWAMEHN